MYRGDLCPFEDGPIAVIRERFDGVADSSVGIPGSDLDPELAYAERLSLSLFGGRNRRLPHSKLDVRDRRRISSQVYARVSRPKFGPARGSRTKSYEPGRPPVSPFSSFRPGIRQFSFHTPAPDTGVRNRCTRLRSKTGRTSGGWVGLCRTPGGWRSASPGRSGRSQSFDPSPSDLGLTNTICAGGLIVHAAGLSA